MFHFDLIGLELSNGNLILYSVETIHFPSDGAVLLLWRFIFPQFFCGLMGKEKHTFSLTCEIAKIFRSELKRFWTFSFRFYIHILNQLEIEALFALTSLGGTVPLRQNFNILNRLSRISIRRPKRFNIPCSKFAFAWVGGACMYWVCKILKSWLYYLPSVGHISSLKI